MNSRLLNRFEKRKGYSVGEAKAVVEGTNVVSKTANVVELSPFESVLFYLIEPVKNHFLGIIENDLDSDGINLDRIPTEND